MKEKYFLAYMVGFLEADGCVSISKHKKYLNLIISVGQTKCKRPLDLYKKYFGGNIYSYKNINKNSKYKYAHKWSVSGKLALRAYYILKPYFYSQTKIIKNKVKLYEKYISTKGITNKGRPIINTPLKLL